MSQLTDNRDRDVLVTFLRSLKVVIAYKNACKCPFHDDKRASAGIYLGDDQIWRFKCQACGVGGDVYDLTSRVDNRPLADVLKEASERNMIDPLQKALEHKTGMRLAPKERAENGVTLEQLEAGMKKGKRTRHVYNQHFNAATGEVGYIVLRSDFIGADGKPDKDIRPATCMGDGWIMRAPAARPLHIYRRDLLPTAKRVVVVEGEKAADALNAAGIVATTNPMGAGKGEECDWTPLAGKDVILWPDADPINAPGKPLAGLRTGVEHMRQVAKILQAMPNPPRVHWLDPFNLGLPEKGDAFDLVDMNTDDLDPDPAFIVDMLEDVLYNARPMDASADLDELFDDIFAGRRKTLSTPWPWIGAQTNMLKAGTVSVLCGNPGSSKSYFMFELFLHLHDMGHKTAIYALEENRQYYLHRLLAMLANDTRLLSENWIDENREYAVGAKKQFAPLLGSFGAGIVDNVDDSVTLKHLTEWVHQKAIDGCEAIAIDPVTVALTTGKIAEDDRLFITSVKRIARDYHTRVLLVTHPKTGAGVNKNEVGMHSMAGGAAYSRFPQTVIWLDKPEESVDVNVYGMQDLRMPSLASADRIMKMFKTRNGVGAGKKIAMGWNREGSALRLTELGLVVKVGQ